MVQHLPAGAVLSYNIPDAVAFENRCSKGTKIASYYNGFDPSCGLVDDELIREDKLIFLKWKIYIKCRTG
jgi:hypothetical protein